MKQVITNVNKVLNTSIWCLTFAVVMGVIFIPSALFKVTTVFQVLIWCLTIPSVAFLVSKTNEGQVFYEFAKEAYIELLKVVWPSQTEVFQTSGVVVAAVVFVAVIIGIIDSLINYLFGLIG